VKESIEKMALSQEQSPVSIARHEEPAIRGSKKRLPALVALVSFLPDWL